MHRELLYCLVLTLIFLSPPGFSQKQVAIKFNLTAPMAKTFNIASEWAFTERFSGQVVYFNTSDFTLRDSKGTEHIISGYGLTPEARFHLRAQRLKGFYLGPYLRFRYLTWEIPSIPAAAKVNSVSGGFTVGYQALIKDILIFDFFIGPAFGSHAIRVTAGGADDFKLGAITTPVGVRSGIAIGIALF